MLSPKVTPKLVYYLYRCKWVMSLSSVPCIRVPEIVFQPMMVGVDQSGITETTDFVLQKYSPDIQQRLVNVGT